MSQGELNSEQLAQVEDLLLFWLGFKDTDSEKE